MSKLIVLRGVPASGKSSWAKEWVATDPDHRARVNRDDIRFELFGQYWDVDEQAVNAVEKATVRALLDAGKDVVVDATNLRAKYAKAWFQFGVPIVWRDFPVTLVEALARDNNRHIAGERSVGEDVIRGFFNSFSINKETGKLPAPPVAPEAAVAPVFEPVEFIPGLPEAIILDVDGTAAQMVSRGPYDTSRYAEDVADKAVRALVQMVANSGVAVLVTSGRDEAFYGVTAKWLADHDIPCDRLIMRGQGDLRNDSIVKNELYETRIKGFWNVLFAVDDRNRVVDMWRAKGIKCFQAQPGDF